MKKIPWYKFIKITKNDYEDQTIGTALPLIAGAGWLSFFILMYRRITRKK